MNGNQLLDLIGETNSEYVDCAEKTARVKNRKRRWVGFSGLAAALLAVAVSIGFFVNDVGGNAGGGGLAPGESYMYYAGPILPLTAKGDVSGLNVTREVNFDFSPYISKADGEYLRWQSEAVITDGYVLSNTTENDITMEAVYHFVGRLRFPDEYPVISVDGSRVEFTVYPGAYAGGYRGVLGDKNDTEGTVNLDHYGSFEDYEAALSDGSYMENAFSEKSDLDIPVTVYRMGDYVYTSDETAEAPTISFDFYFDSQKTSVLTWGVDGGSNSSGFCRRQVGGVEFRPNASPGQREPSDAYIVVIGEDIDSYSIQGYRDGGCREGDELNDLTCTVTRYETTLGEFIKERISQSEYFAGQDEELLFASVSELIMSYGPLSENMVQRYSNGSLDEIVAEANNNQRVIYAAFEVTVPAGGSVKISAETVKDASMDYVGKYKERNGYDMATTLGTVFDFETTVASVSGYDEVEIIAQNFGFDLSAGITEVTLDPAQGHYWLEVCKTKSEEK